METNTQTTPDQPLRDAACSRSSIPTPRTDAARREFQELYDRGKLWIAAEKTLLDMGNLERDYADVQTAYGRQYFRIKELLEAVEAADECLALIEDVGHGAHIDNVTVARRIIAKVIYSANEKSPSVDETA